MFPFSAAVQITQTLDIQKVPRNVAEKAEKLVQIYWERKGIYLVLQTNKAGKYNLNVTSITATAPGSVLNTKCIPNQQVRNSFQQNIKKKKSTLCNAFSLIV